MSIADSRDVLILMNLTVQLNDLLKKAAFQRKDIIIILNYIIS